MQRLFFIISSSPLKTVQIDVLEANEAHNGQTLHKVYTYDNMLSECEFHFVFRCDTTAYKVNGKATMDNVFNLNETFSKIQGL